jgi:N-acetylglucosaminyldiphosphoundecaprenol N-acetyl-beta-D-mannosaminyltransferase
MDTGNVGVASRDPVDVDVDPLIGSVDLNPASAGRQVLGDLPRRLKRITILGVPICVTNMRDTVDAIGSFIADRRARYVCACDVHSVMRAHDDPRHMATLSAADLLLPDGVPLVWVARMRGERDAQRVCGPDLMHALCERSVSEGWRHYFLGGAEGTAAKLGQKLTEKYPGLTVVGSDCAAFGTHVDQEVDAAIARIRPAGPHIVWIGLGCPKQERWMYQHCAKLDGMVLIGVGAAFDFNSGQVRRAPLWMQSRGLEWLHRLLSDPRRLWHRYLILAPRFVYATAIESLGRRVWRRPGATAGRRRTKSVVRRFTPRVTRR